MGSNAGKTNAAPAAVTFDDGRLIFTNFEEADPITLTEAARWSGGRRGGPVPLPELTGADLTAFARTAIRVGAQVIAVGSDTAGVASLAGTVAQLSDRAEAASQALATDVSRASAEASKLTAKAARDAAETTAATLTAARTQAAADLNAAVTAATERVNAELARLFGGEDTSVARSVRDLVGQEMADSGARMQRAFTETLSSVSLALDVANPASPIARLEQRLADRQDRQHADVKAGIEKVQDAVAAGAAAMQTAAAVSAVQAKSAGKGRPFEEAAGTALEEIAAGLGGSYHATGDVTGTIRGCRKGDGILEVPGIDGNGPVRVVIEMTTSGAPRKWAPYLAEAERNREAAASLGVVPSADLVPGKAALSAIAPNRIIVAYDDSNTAVLRAAVVLLALRAQRDAARELSGVDFTAADAHLREAEQFLSNLAEVLKTANAVKAGASKIVLGIENTHVALARSLASARGTLRGTPSVKLAPAA